MASGPGITPREGFKALPLARARVKLVLASTSPRRTRLLTEAGIRHEVLAVEVDERAPRGASAPQAAMAIAERKAKAPKVADAFVLAADTIVDHHDQLLGKPMDELEAHTILRQLSGETHRVVTGVALRSPDGKVRTAYAETMVTFRELTDEEIDAYIRTGEPMDKAGAYGIQGRAKAFVARVDGPMDNVVGLPIDIVRRLLADAGASG